MGRRKGRILAFQALYAWEAGAVDTANILTFSWANPTLLERLGEEGLTFSRIIVQGTLDNLSEIDEKIKGNLENWDFSRLNKVDLAILRTSVYALLYQKDIHPSITIDEAIQISQEFGSDDSFRFINGILGTIHAKNSSDPNASENQN